MRSREQRNTAREHMQDKNPQELGVSRFTQSHYIQCNKTAVKHDTVGDTQAGLGVTSCGWHVKGEVWGSNTSSPPCPFGRRHMCVPFCLSSRTSMLGSLAFLQHKTQDTCLSGWSEQLPAGVPNSMSSGVRPVTQMFKKAGEKTLCMENLSSGLHSWSTLRCDFLGKSLKALQVLAFSLKYKRSATKIFLRHM